MNPKINYAELNQLLENLGFQRETITGSHVRWSHAQSETLFLLPESADQAPVAEHDLQMIRRFLDLKGLLDVDAFDRWRSEIQSVRDTNGANAILSRSSKRKTRSSEHTSSS